MRVKVKLFGPLIERIPPEQRRMPIEIELDDGTTVSDVANSLGIGNVRVFILINDQEGHKGKRLKDGDVISFFPPIEGG